MGILTRPRAAEFCRRAREDGQTVVFTNGCFDIIHRGHVDLLRAAREKGDILVVGLNSDASVRTLKGSGRPLVPVEDRAAILESLRDVDVVVIFEEETPLELIRELRPSVLVKGGDYRAEDVVGGEDVVSWGGKVEIVPLTPGKSTTDLADRITKTGKS